jgi:hypothetical protein
VSVIKLDHRRQLILLGLLVWEMYIQSETKSPL